MNIELYNKLCKVRQELRDKYAKVGKPPVICHDEELISIAELKPRAKEELLYINGLGQAFMEKYGDDFIKVIEDYYRSLNTHEAIDNDIRDTLKNYEKRLVNINKRNRLLYSGKLYQHSSFDLFNQEMNQPLLRLIHNKMSSVELCNTQTAEGLEKYKKLSTLIREANSIYREKGDFDLYIGYPFVEGYFEDDDFCVRAPLVLFPVKVEKTNKKIVIEIDYSKDILYNNVLILLYNKYNNIYNDLPLDIVEEIGDRFLEETVNHYADVGIKIDLDISLNEVEKYIEYNKNTFPKYRDNELKLIPNMVLGRFSLFSSAIQKDYKTLIEATNLPSLLFNLLNEKTKIPKIINTDEISEKNINYITDLDGSQERAIYQMNYLDSLVIQGPPGTGKSQTITSLIVDTLSKNKTVLMVSEKKAALEVIYSRLGDISKYAMLLNDVNDKEFFYQQLNNLIKENPLLENNEKVKNSELAEKIDLSLKELEKIKYTLYDHKINNVPAITIFQENINNSIRESECLKDYLRIIDKSLLDADYEELKVSKELFSKNDFLDSCLNVLNIKHKYPWLDEIRELSYEDNIEFMRDVNDFYKYHNEYLKRNFIVRIFKNSKERKFYKKLYSNYFLNNTHYKYLYHHFDELKISSRKLNKYKEDLINYHTLTQTEKLYVDTLFNLSLHNLTVSNELLFDIVIANTIEKFTYENQDVMKSIQKYPQIIENVVNLIDEKKQTTSIMLQKDLHKQYVNTIEDSKRFFEIKRAIEGKRKPSIGRFINKFRFELFKGIKIWLMTPETVSTTLPLAENLFDLLIFDEASQIYIEKSLPAIYRANKIVISGDTKQLNPSSLGFSRFDERSDDEFDETITLEEKSLLDLAKYRYSEVLLNYHYRSKYEELINFSNAAYYDFKLNVSPNIIKPINSPIEVIKIDNGTFIKRKNKAEALKAIELLKKIFNERKNNETIGIITFNSSQRDLIEDLLDDEFIKNSEFGNLCKAEFNRVENGEDKGLFIKNIENVQGDERDIIIFVVGYAKGEHGTISTNFGWLNQLGGENRLNVAASRAKQKIYLITSIYPSELAVDNSKNEGPKLFKKYLEYAYAVSNKDHNLEKTLLNSLSKKQNDNFNSSFSAFENDVYNYLNMTIDHELFTIDKKVGNSNYKISLGIKSNKTNEYVLGIICDNALSDTFISTKDRDIFRNKYLANRGWKIIPIWSINWCKSPIDETNKVIDILNEIANS